MADETDDTSETGIVHEYYGPIDDLPHPDDLEYPLIFYPDIPDNIEKLKSGEETVPEPDIALEDLDIKPGTATYADLLRKPWIDIEEVSDTERDDEKEYHRRHF